MESSSDIIACPQLSKCSLSSLFTAKSQLSIWCVDVLSFKCVVAARRALARGRLAGFGAILGFQARRVNFWKNESSYLTPLSAAQGIRGHFRASLAATLVGIDAPRASRLLEVKPCTIADVTTSVEALPPIWNDVSGDLGVDVKYVVTSGLTADFTSNPDFAQVEADEQ